MAYTRPSGPDETMLNHVAAMRGVRETYPGGAKKKWPLVVACVVFVLLIASIGALWVRYGSFSSGIRSQPAPGPPGVIVDDETGETMYQWGMGPGPSGSME